MELRKERDMHLERRKREDRQGCTLEKERDGMSRVPGLRAFTWKCQGKDSIEYSSDFQVCPLRVVIPRIGAHQGRGSQVTATGPDVSRGVAPSDFTPSLGLEWQHSSGLDVISRG